MNKPTIVNMAEFTTAAELDLITQLGFPTVNVSLEDLGKAGHVDNNNRHTEVAGILRANRIEWDQYSAVYAELAGRGIRLRNSPEISQMLSEFALHYPLIRDVSPKSLVVPSSSLAEDLVTQIKSAGIGPSVFIKTERKSLKADSMVNEVTVENVERCLAALTKAFGAFNSYVVKEMVPLESVDHRAVVFGTHILGFDTGPHVNDVNVTSSRAFEFVNDVVAMLLRKGLKGDYVIDVSRRTDTGAFVVVEIKDLQFTQIKQPRHIWGQLARYCPFE